MIATRTCDPSFLTQMRRTSPSNKHSRTCNPTSPARVRPVEKLDFEDHVLRNYRWSEPFHFFVELTYALHFKWQSVGTSNSYA